MLPGLAPHHTRQSFCSGTRLYVEKVAQSPDDFVLTNEGLWLLPPSVAERDRAAGELKLGDLALQQFDAGMDADAEFSRAASEVYSQTEVTQTGCMVGGLERELDMSVGDFVLCMAGAEWGAPVLDEVDDLPYLRICKTDDCYNTRHYDLDFAKLSVQRRMTELNPLWYEVDDGDVETIWGDSLASLEESMQLYIKLQKMNYPNVTFGQSPLTPSGVSQVNFHPLTGCWETWMYNIKPDGSLGGRFEGYGNLYFKYRPPTVDHQTGEIIPEKRRGHWLAHRTMWLVMGGELDTTKVLNHLCNYKRCCNPLHLEQIPEEANKAHGRRAREYIREIERDDPNAREFYLGAAEVAELSSQARTMYANLV